VLRSLGSRTAGSRTAACVARRCSRTGLYSPVRLGSLPAVQQRSTAQQPIGFNSYLYSITESFQTASWLNLTGRRELTLVELEKSVLDFLDKSLKKFLVFNMEDLNFVVKTIEEFTSKILVNNKNVLNKIEPNNFLIEINISDYFKSLSNKILELIARIFRAVPVEGALDDLMGHQLVILFSLFLIISSVTILFIIYFILNLIIRNQEYIINKFNNKYIKLYIRYKLILVKIATIPCYAGSRTAAYSYYSAVPCYAAVQQGGNLTVRDCTIPYGSSSTGYYYRFIRINSEI
jgi:hypothetical protein